MDIIERIDKLLTDTLEPLSIQSFYGWYDKDINETHVTFTLLTDSDGDFSDDEAEDNTQLFQVDIWSRENIEDLKKTIKAAMKSLDNCTYTDGADFYETDTKIYHKAARFSITQEVM
ncbi:hypothetical protein [Clostridium sp. BL-8]|uniref:hypothetical protein n=1 Tax=Clostridium sp. BL-8 TaxID=349938 RepID=UPI00098BE09B|nr:hypothetical protein [Clostridium sp. BL-8]OOM75498.1 hypothetical protein CLOBL_39880 [Clostridium sp. BL-8]